jgi:hypothetical protein
MQLSLSMPKDNLSWARAERLCPNTHDSQTLATSIVTIPSSIDTTRACRAHQSHRPSFDIPRLAQSSLLATWPYPNPRNNDFIRNGKPTTVGQPTDARRRERPALQDRHEQDPSRQTANQKRHCSGSDMPQSSTMSPSATGPVRHT